jgi:hypothetical protein
MRAVDAQEMQSRLEVAVAPQAGFHETVRLEYKCSGEFGSGI